MAIAPVYRTLPHLVLASASPRRAQLLQDMGLTFEVFIPQVDERTIVAPNHDLAQVLAQSKCRNAQATHPESSDKLFLAADTIVVLDGERLDKPTDAHEAKTYLRRLAEGIHEVYTGVALRCNSNEFVFQSLTRVLFSQLSEEEIDYYVTTFAPLDKAGAYGIQEWIGLVGIKQIEGSYTNVMGLPTEALHRALLSFVQR